MLSSDTTNIEDPQSSIDLLSEEMPDIMRELKQASELDIVECLTEEAFITDSSDYLSSLSDSSDVSENVNDTNEEIFWDKTFEDLSELSLTSAM